MRIIRRVPLTFERVLGGSYYDDDGDPVPSATTPINALGSLQPFKKGNSKIVLPEGVSASDAFTYYTETLIQGENQFSKEAADKTTIKGQTYRAFHAMDWSINLMKSDHFKVILVKDDLDTGI